LGPSHAATLRRITPKILYDRTIFRGWGPTHVKKAEENARLGGVSL